ncbi:MAG: hypothetical protein ACXWRE_07480 [Pseudobdellovibrionaceae bacterium]
MTSSLDPNLELYRIISDQEGHFVILAKDQLNDPNAINQAQRKMSSVKKDFFLLLNPGLNYLPIKFL